MSEQLGLPPSVTTLIRRPEDFDKDFQEGVYEVVDTLGCATMGLLGFLLDARTTEMHRDQYFEQIPMVGKITGVWPFRRVRRAHAPTALYLIHLNRIFGGSAGEKDVLWSEAPDLAKHIQKARLPWVDLERLGNSGKPPTGRSRQTYNMLALEFGESGVIDLANKARFRRGVQVIYGGPGFEDYVQRYSVSDDNHPMARKTEGRRMPLEFFRAILPLGEYEQRKLLGG